MEEYGLFSDEGLVEGGFYSVEEAAAAKQDRYEADDGLDIEEVCPDHPEHPRNGCEECDMDETAEEEAEAITDEDDEEDYDDGATPQSVADEDFRRQHPHDGDAVE